MNTPKELGQRLRDLRVKEGLSRDEVANRLGLSPKTVAHYEIGRNNFTIQTFEKIVDSLGYKLVLTLEPNK